MKLEVELTSESKKEITLEYIRNMWFDDMVELLKEMAQYHPDDVKEASERAFKWI